MKLRIVLLFTLIICSVILLAPPKGKAENCEGTIVADMGDIKLNIPRELLNRIYNEDPSDDQWFKDCSVQVIKNAHSVYMFKHRIILIKLGTYENIDGTTYSRYRDYISEARQNDEITILSNGLEHFVSPNEEWELYILPKDVAPTANEEPVVLICGERVEQFNIDSCSTVYEYPTGVRFSYSFSRAQHQIDEYIEMDQHKRAILNRMIVQ